MTDSQKLQLIAGISEFSEMLPVDRCNLMALIANGDQEGIEAAQEVEGCALRLKGALAELDAAQARYGEALQLFSTAVEAAHRVIREACSVTEVIEEPQTVPRPVDTGAHAGFPDEQLASSRILPGGDDDVRLVGSEEPVPAGNR